MKFDTLYNSNAYIYSKACIVMYRIVFNKAKTGNDTPAKEKKKR